MGKNGRTALWHCFDRKSKESCELLLSRDDIDVNLCDEHGNRPIHLAAEWGDVDVMSSLLAKPDVRFGDEDFFGTPLHYAVYEQHVAIVELLLRKYRATKCGISYSNTTTQWPADPNTLKAAKYRRWLGSDMANLPEKFQRDNTDLGKELLAIAAANRSPSCFMLLESYLGIWNTLPQVWKRKCLLAAAESGGEETLRYILKVLRLEENLETSAAFIHLGRQSWDSVDVFDLARRATGKELNSWDSEGQTAIHAATGRKDMRTVRICMAMGGDHMAKNMAGHVAEDCMEEINDFDILGKMDHWVYNCMIQERPSEKYSAIKSA